MQDLHPDKNPIARNRNRHSNYPIHLSCGHPNDGPFGFAPRRENVPHSTRTNDPGRAASTAAAIFATWLLIMRQLCAESETMASFRPFRFCWRSIDRSPVTRTSKPAPSAALRRAPFWKPPSPYRPWWPFRVLQDAPVTGAGDFRPELRASFPADLTGQVACYERRRAIFGS